MSNIVLIYGSSEGQTAKIASHIAAVIREKGHTIEMIHGRALPAYFTLNPYDAAIIGASIHAGGYQKYIREFIQKHLAELERMPTAFFSVSLTEASSHPEEKASLENLIAAFLQKTGWNPRQVVSFAGALAYSQYGFFKRRVMRRIARQEGAPTDTTHDYEFTDWDAVTRFAENFVDTLKLVQISS